MEQTKTPVPTIVDTPIEGLKIINPKLFSDNRGFFSETYNVVEWKEKLGFEFDMQQDNHSYSKQGVLRGLHAQPGMGKLVQVIVGKIYDVAVDIRKGSPTYGQSFGVMLDDKLKQCFWVPDGFLHGFQVLSPDAHVHYKCSSVYNAATEFGVSPYDPQLKIDWPLPRERSIVSDRDAGNPTLEQLNV